MKRMWWTLRRWLFGERRRIYVDDVLVAEVKSRRKHIYVDIEPGMVRTNGPGILRIEPSARADDSITVVYRTPGPKLLKEPYRDAHQ